MQKTYWNAQVHIINTLRKFCGQILTLNISNEEMTIVTPFIDEEVLPEIDLICKKNKLCYVYKPHTIDTRRQTKYEKIRGKLKPSVMWKFFVNE